jgi:ornithine cyclodeaminase/alanine dehydrogenase-like protein (mu-crystallin family)
MAGIRVLRETDVRAALDMASCVDACERAFEAYSTGSAELPGVIHLDVPEHGGEIHVKAGHLHGEPYYAVKVSSGFPGADATVGDGMVLVFDARDGSPAAVLLDRGFVTDQRTGAAGGVAARHLAPDETRTVAVLGTGIQARYQLDGLASARPGFAEVRIWGRNRDRADRCAGELRTRPGLPMGCDYRVAGSIGEATDGADVVITCTASLEPLLEPGHLKRRAHVTAVGSDGPDKQELDPQILALADVLAVDSREQCGRLGELHHAIDAGAVDSDSAVELGEICAGTAAGRSEPDQLTVCDLTGLGVQDVAAANVVMVRAADRGDLLQR